MFWFFRFQNKGGLVIFFLNAPLSRNFWKSKQIFEHFRSYRHFSVSFLCCFQIPRFYTRFQRFTLLFHCYEYFPHLPKWVTIYKKYLCILTLVYQKKYEVTYSDILTLRASKMLNLFVKNGLISSWTLLFYQENILFEQVKYYHQSQVCLCPSCLLLL